MTPSVLEGEAPAEPRLAGRFAIPEAGQWYGASPILRRMPRFGLIVSSIVYCAASLAWGQSLPSHPQQQSEPARKTDSTSGATSKSDPRSHQTAEDLLRALQADRPASEVIVPASRAGKGSVIAAHLLLPEGTAIIERPGRLVRQGTSWDFQPDEGKPISVLPNASLEGMLAMHKDAGGVMGFVVSGEVTVFDNQNFLLIKHVARGTTEKTGQNPVAADASATVPADASVEVVLSALQNQRPVGSGVPESGEGSGGRAPATGHVALLDGSLVVRRPGRLIRENSRWVFVFDDEKATGQSAVALLPNQSLEIMAQSAERGPGGLVFIVSGEMTQFGPDNYLLVRGVTRVLDLGNLRP